MRQPDQKRRLSHQTDGPVQPEELKMKKLIMTAAVAALGTMFAGGPALAADVGVSISIGQPGFYGRIDIGDYGYSNPQVYYPEPVRVYRDQRYQGPIYLRVPPGHRKHWKKHCREYDACGQPVLFVQDNWYNNDYAPRYREYQSRHRGDDHHDRDRDDDHHSGGNHHDEHRENDNGGRGNNNQGNNHQGNQGNGKHGKN